MVVYNTCYYFVCLFSILLVKCGRTFVWKNFKNAIRKLCLAYTMGGKPKVCKNRICFWKWALFPRFWWYYFFWHALYILNRKVGRPGQYQYIIWSRQFLHPERIKNGKWKCNLTHNASNLSSASCSSQRTLWLQPYLCISHLWELYLGHAGDFTDWYSGKFMRDCQWNHRVFSFIWSAMRSDLVLFLHMMGYGR